MAAVFWKVLDGLRVMRLPWIPAIMHQAQRVLHQSHSKLVHFETDALNAAPVRIWPRV